MDFSLDSNQQMIKNTIREFALKELKPIAAEIDKTCEFPEKTVKKMGELGLMGMAIPPEYGGAGTDNVSYAIAVEEVSRICASHGVTMSVNNSLVCHPIYKFGTEEQKKRFLVPLASGQNLGSFGLTEPSAGTDAASQQTTAKKDGKDYIINGQKCFITNASRSQTAIIFAMTDKSKGTKGITAFIVPTDTPGYKIGQLEDKMGIRGSVQAEIIFEEMRIPEEFRLGGEGEGFKIDMATLDAGRIGIAAQAVGIAQGALDEAVEYAKSRVQFGKPIATFQAIQWMIADMETDIQAARLLVYNAAYAKDHGDRFSKEAAMAKLFASDVAVRATRDAIQIHGGYGYTKEFTVERLYRDAKITELYEGTSEVQRMVISGALLR